MEAKTLNEIRIKGFRVLVKNLGLADAIRFIQSYETGTGDYTKERHEWLPDDLDTVKGRLPERQKKQKMKKPHH